MNTCIFWDLGFQGQRLRVRGFISAGCWLGAQGFGFEGVERFGYLGAWALIAFRV